MSEAALKPAIYLLDEAAKGNLNDAPNHLSLELNGQYFDICVSNVARHSQLALLRFNLPQDDESTFNKSFFKEIFNREDWLRKWKQSCSLAVVHHQATIVPKPLFNPDKLSEYLNVSFDMDPKDLMLSDPLSNVKAHNVYAMDSKVHKFFRKKFDNLRVLHHSTSLIESLALHFKEQSEAVMIANVREYALQIVVFENGQLKLYNSFNYNNPEELVYFLLFVFEQLNLNTKSTPLYLSGSIQREDEHWNLIAQYVSKVDILPTDRINISSSLSGIQGHQHFSLFNQYMCGS